MNNKSHNHHMKSQITIIGVLVSFLIINKWNKDKWKKKKKEEDMTVSHFLIWGT